MEGSQLLRLVVGLVAAGLFFYAAQQMDIHSQSGTSIDEAFYQAMGIFSYAMAALSVAVVWPVNPPKAAATNGTEQAPTPATAEPPTSPESL
ncbi:MAG: hypothetical protein ABI785_07810 [Gemmatimonadales bacterium]